MSARLALKTLVGMALITATSPREKGYMKKFTVTMFVCALLATVATGQALATSFTQTADTATAIPAGTGFFTTFPAAPSISLGNVSFLGAGAGGQQGVYAGVPGHPVMPVADFNTAIPLGVGNFTGFIPPNPIIPPNPVISGRNAVFVGTGAGGQQGVYLANDVLIVGPPYKVEIGRASCRERV